MSDLISFASNPGDSLAAFSAPVRTWFQETFGPPTPPQAEGWPAIQRGDHTLILAPTGSGKTLAAFLWGIDQLFREWAGLPTDPAGQPKPELPLRLVYISPLKALNNDIQRNLRTPLAGVRRQARVLGLEFPGLEVAVRSGDTPQRERQAMLRKPPQILITTPESFYLILTSPKAREVFRTVCTVIVDEIHTLAGNKRGVHLSLSLERLQHLADQPVQRIGLSATIRPLDEVAHFLGGNTWQGEEPDRQLVPRPVTLVEASYKKALDLKVETVVEDFRQLPGDSIWPVIIPRVAQLIREHQTTLIFVNNRRTAERTADRLNEQLAAEASGRASGLIEGGVAKGIGMMAAGTGLHSGPIRAHHGSMAKEARLEMERDLKEGRLPALVGTSSLELGIDIGAVDLVVQLQSPKSVAQGLQRVGRSGHLVGQTSKGRFFPTHREDVMEAAAIAGGMRRGEVEPTYTPRNALDILAQQLVAMVSLETWPVEALFDLVRCAYAYQELTPRVFRAVLEMLSGRYEHQSFRELRARLAWDPVNNKVAALPGARLMALAHGGTITDRGSFGAYLSDGKTKLGELDEEFVYETRVGDTMMLGSQVWRVLEITDDRVLVAEAPGITPRMPFWRGDYPWRPYELGQKVGAFRRRVAGWLGEIRASLNLAEHRDIAEKWDEPAVQTLLAQLQEEYALDRNSAWQVLTYVAGQLDKAGAISSDRTILVEVFDDALGDPRLVVHSPFGGRVNGPWGLALASLLRERTGINVELQTNDDGILLRCPEAEAEFPLRAIAGLTPAEARERILRELPDSAVFGAQFRQNAARALLLPGVRGRKRTPFWLQRLRAKDLLQTVRHFRNFPIIAETYRDCLQDVMDLPHLETVLAGIQHGEIQLVLVESLTPSPVAQSLLWDFISIYMYEWDTPRAERQLQTLATSRELLQDLLQGINLSELLRPEALGEVVDRLQHTAPTTQARTREELAVLLQQLGDLSSVELAERATIDPAGWLAELAGAGRIVEMAIPTTRGPVRRWVAAEYEPEYRAAFGLPGPAEPAMAPEEARRRILERWLAYTGPVTLPEILGRYAFPSDWLQAELERLVAARHLAHGQFTPAEIQAEPRPSGEAEFIDRRTLEQLHRRTLTILRREVEAVPYAVYAGFLARWQHLHPAERLAGPGALTQVLQQLRAVPVAGSLWERDILPLRLVAYNPAELATLCQSGEVVWIGAGGADLRRGRIRFLFRGEGNLFLEPAPADLSELSPPAQAVYDFLKQEGAVFLADIRAALDLTEESAQTALVELVMAGLVTNDSLEVLRQMIQRGSGKPTAEPKPFSSLEAQLAERLGARSTTHPGGVRRPSRTEYQVARRRVRERLAQPAEPPRPAWSEGRWTLVHRFGVLGKVISPAERAAYQARQLLARYGVVTRTTLDNETGSWEWEPIYQQLQRLELRGEVRRGYFIQGLAGVQFALPEVVERLRAGRSDEDEALIVLNAADPANLYGPALEGGPQAATGEPLSFPRLTSTWLVQQRGLPLLVAGNTATHLTTVQGVDEGSLLQALHRLLEHLAGFERRISVESWNGEPVLDSPGRPLLEAAGFYRDYPGMTWRKKAGT